MELPAPSEVLLRAAEQAPGRIVRVVVAGQSLYIKRAAKDTAAAAARQRLARRAGKTFDAPPLKLDASERLGREAARLATLRAAGARVPQVVAWWPGHLALEDVGESVRFAVARQDAGQRLALLQALAADLGAFHAAGHWHGGSQYKNHALQGHEVWRFDFEEAFDSITPLAAIQARDVYLQLHSWMDLAPDPEAWAAAFFSAYQQHNPDEGVRARLAAAGRRMAFSRRLGSLFLPVAGKDLVRFVRAARALARL